MSSLNRFRWAACQIDLLRRLTVSSDDEIREALRSTPKTLDETYDKIFELIADKAPDLVRAALFWVEFTLRRRRTSDGISLDTLIRLLLCPDSTSSLVVASSREKEEWLQDICGCLIRVGMDNCNNHERVNFAHYTVREYLKSDRIRKSSAKYFQIDNASLLHHCAPIIFDKIPSRTFNDHIDEKMLARKFTSYWRGSVCSLFQAAEVGSWGEGLLSNKSLREMLYAFLRRRRLQELWLLVIVRHGRCSKLLRISDGFGPQDEVSDVSLLLRCLLMKSYGLAGHLLADKGAATLFQTQVCITTHKECKSIGRRTCEISGTILDVFVKMWCHEGQRPRIDGILNFLLQTGMGHFNPSFVLVLLCLGNPAHLRQFTCPNGAQNCVTPPRCLYHTLYDQGADPNWAETPLTALQMSVVRQDMGSVGYLLERGADPNYIGDGTDHGLALKLGFGLEEMALFKEKSPLQICRHFMAGEELKASVPENGTQLRSKQNVGSVLKTIETLLTRAGAKDFMKPGAGG